jgi:hypothetical protein
MLSVIEQQKLLSSFPNAELSYETLVHNKVPSADYCLAIPIGAKSFMWFTQFKNQNVCIAMEINANKKIGSIRLHQCCFHDKLSFGTILYGTLFKYNSSSFFSIENILYYKGLDISTKSFEYKLDIIANMLSREMRPVVYTIQSVIFGLPLITQTVEELLRHIPLLPYSIQYVQFRDNKKHYGNDCFNVIYDANNTNIFKNTTQNFNRQNENCEKKVCVFIVRPDIQNDIYHLFTHDEKNNEVYHNVACINNYTSSVMMNKLFRNIKENKNLDALEESDDEEEFENDNEDKFVFLARSHKMVCQFNHKFRKWTPTRLAQKNDVVITTHECNFLEKK